MNTKDIGSRAENHVAVYLKNQGYEILELNWKRPYAEIDIVAKKVKTIYFVEVKYRSSVFAGDGFDYITNTKLKHMERAALSWVEENKWQEDFQLLAVSMVGDDVQVREIM